MHPPCPKPAAALLCSSLKWHPVATGFLHLVRKRESQTGYGQHLKVPKRSHCPCLACFGKKLQVLQSPKLLQTGSSRIC
ncbi:hypothetical protein E2320_017900 [Naja naja]|nr:hypothetical protein E2320_017900 [Naja naja]